MPTVNWEVRKQSPHYRLYSLERFFLAKKIRCLRYMLFIQLLNQNSAGSTDNSEFINILAISMMIMSFQNDLFRLRPSNFYPPEGFYPNGSFDPFWSRDEEGLEMFLMRFRFRLPHFHRLMTAMGLDGKYFTCEQGNKYRADFCMMVLLRRLAYPCTFKQLVAEFGIPSHRLCEIFHVAVEFVFDRYHALIEFETWTPFFEQFAEIFVEYGSPFPSLVGLLDGNFLRFCRPRGLGNKRSRLDQGQFYTGEKCAHGVKHLAAFFPNGMTALAGPFLGTVGDGRMTGESGWLNMLRRRSLIDNIRYKLFGDAAFGVSNFIQSMLKGEAAIRPEGRAFNALMSRIRVNIENAFGHQSNLFTFLAFHRSLKLGGRNVLKIYKVACILMNMRCTFYGNQFTHQLGHALHMEIEDLLSLCPTPGAN